jgi:hypothetical protein
MRRKLEFLVGKFEGNKVVDLEAAGMIDFITLQQSAPSQMTWRLQIDNAAAAT